MADQNDPQDIFGDCRGAIQRGEIETLYSLIENHPSVLVQFDNIPFVETPLHVAASVGDPSFVVMIMTFKPSLARKLNQRGFSPLHLALEQIRRDPNQQTQSDPTQQTEADSIRDFQARLRQVVGCLLNFDKDLVRVKGNAGLTPLHHAVQIGDLELLIKFLITCPKSIIDVTGQNETALHIALNQENLESFVLLNEWLHEALFEDAIWWTKTLEKWEDGEGQTFPKIAEGREQELLQVDHERIISTLKRDPTLNASLLRLEEGTSRVLLTIAALLVTLTFQITINPPGGTWKEDYTCLDPSSCMRRPSHSAGAAIMSRYPFVIVAVFSALSLLYSFIAVFLLLPYSPSTMLCIFPILIVGLYFTASFSILAPDSFPIRATGLIGISIITCLLLVAFTAAGRNNVSKRYMFRRPRYVFRWLIYRRTGN